MKLIHLLLILCLLVPSALFAEGPGTPPKADKSKKQPVKPEQPEGEVLNKDFIVEQLTKPTQSGEPASLAFSSDAILFGYGSAKLLDKSIPQLQEIAKALKDPVLAVIPFFFVDGHTCSIGTDANNCQLSRDRAASVVKFLIEKGGVPKAKLKARGFGEREPMVSNDTEANRKKNRRVVLKSGLLELKKDKEKQCAAGKE